MTLKLTQAPWPDDARNRPAQEPAWCSDRSLHSTHRSLLDRIHRLQQWKGYAWIGRRELAMQHGIHVGHLQRIMRECRRLGWLAYVPGRGRDRTLYRVVDRSIQLVGIETAIAQAEAALAKVDRPGHDPLPQEGFPHGALITGGQVGDSSDPRSLRVSARAHSDCAPALTHKEGKRSLKSVSPSQRSPRAQRPDPAQGDLFRGQAFDPFQHRLQVWQSDSDIGEALQRASRERCGLLVELEGKEWIVREVMFNGVLVRLALFWGDEAKTVELRYRPDLQQTRFWRASRSKA